ncbi:hypothetical protein [Actomonas aquatica]|uniref:Tetratricopeptide repeat protein n=1 Tax=Actomonas aquatica TaxID=2866162 RepID=A0ABZ1C9Q9_9BACT|nr:hypothetical protein [Opitutus sp. WL0086]WRQ88421.1 hypothetical protein K1X11_003330 [Opitutus sp. WL0086]
MSIRFLKIIGLLAVAIAASITVARTLTPRLRERRIQEFVTQGDAARANGELRTARTAYQSALRLDPQRFSARVGAIQACLDENDFSGALALSQALPNRGGASGEQFVFDALLLRREFAKLAVFCGQQISAHEDATKHRWFRDLLVSARIARLPLPLDCGYSPATRALLEAHNAQLSGTGMDAVIETLTGLASDRMSPPEMLLVFSAQLELAGTHVAEMLLLREGHRLSEFDRALCEWQLESRRRSWAETSTWSALLRVANTPARRTIVSTHLLEAVHADLAAATLQAWHGDASALPLETTGACWAVAQRHGLEGEVRFWAETYRRRTGRHLPSLLGEYLGGTDPEQSLKASELMVGHVPLDRGMILALRESLGSQASPVAVAGNR